MDFAYPVIRKGELLAVTTGRSEVPMAPDGSAEHHHTRGIASSRRIMIHESRRFSQHFLYRFSIHGESCSCDSR